jgi:hypothetical protein
VARHERPEPVMALPAEPALPRGRERRCPVYRRERISPVGHVLAADELITSQHPCEVVRGRVLV